MNYQFHVLLEVPNVRLFLIKGQQSKLISQGHTLQVLESEQLNLHFLKMNDFQYTLQKNIPFLIQSLQNEETVYIMPALEDAFYGLIVPHCDQVSEVFDFLLANKATLVQPKDNQNLLTQSLFTAKHQMQEIPQQGQVPQTQLLQQNQVQLANVNLWNHVGPGEKKPTLGDYIQKGGSLVRDGLVYAAGIVGSGIKKGGEYIAGNVTKEEKQIDDSTVNKVSMLNTGTKAIVIFTKAQLEALVNFGKMVGEEASKQFASSETGKQIQQYRYYAEVKDVGVGAIYACVSVYDGLCEALGVLVKNTGEATTDIVQQKYGDKAGELSKQGFQVAGNIMELDRIYVNVAANAIKQQQQQQEQPQQQQQQQQQQPLNK